MQEITEDPQRVALHEEVLHLQKVSVETDRVRVRTIVDERAAIVEGVVERGVIDVSRVPVEIEVTIAPPPREEGDTLVVSVVEERMVVVKKLFVIEEVHLRRTAAQAEVSIPTTLRSMRAEIVRDAPTPPQAGEPT